MTRLRAQGSGRADNMEVDGEVDGEFDC